MIQTASDPAWVLNAATVETLLREIGFKDEIIDFLRKASCDVAQSNDVSQFLDVCRHWPQKPAQYSGRMFQSSRKALAVVSQFPATLEKHHARGVPEKISHATLRDLERHMEFSDGCWQFDNLVWLRNHVAGEFFEVGRLQYHLGTFGYGVRVYRDSVSGEIVTLALSGRHCTPGGWPRDDARAFETRLEVGGEGIFGHPVSPANGAIGKEIKCLPADSTLVLNDQSTVAHVHIPSGDKLEMSACRASMLLTRKFLAEHFPEMKLRGFVTATWLLDRELARVLPPDSNITAFGRLFRPLPLLNANDHQLLERAFGREATWENCQAVSSLQKAVLKHHRDGGKFRVTAGFILPDDIVAPCHSGSNYAENIENRDTRYE